MSREFRIFLLIIFVGASCLAGAAYAGGAKLNKGPQLDGTLMGFKEQGVWYFPCVAPEFHWRIPPHYLTCAPPPPCWPVEAPKPGVARRPSNGPTPVPR